MHHRVRSDLRGRELRARHDPVLPASDRRDRPVANQHFVDVAMPAPARSTFFLYSQHFVDLARNAMLKSTKCCLGHAH